jgi:hypothetical protein
MRGASVFHSNAITATIRTDSIAGPARPNRPRDADAHAHRLARGRFPPFDTVVRPPLQRLDRTLAARPDQDTGSERPGQHRDPTKPGHARSTTHESTGLKMAGSR